MSRSAAPPTSPSHASGVGPSLSPRKGGEGLFGRISAGNVVCRQARRGAPADRPLSGG
jgi:hypothetical protein